MKAKCKHSRLSIIFYQDGFLARPAKCLDCGARLERESTTGNKHYRFFRKLYKEFVK